MFLGKTATLCSYVSRVGTKLKKVVMQIEVSVGVHNQCNRMLKYNIMDSSYLFVYLFIYSFIQSFIIHLFNYLF
jgi:hypothetical protein